MPLFGKRRMEEPAPQAPVNPADELFQSAVELSNQELHSEAIVAFGRLLQAYPEFQPDIVHYGMALAYDAMGMEEQAIEELHNVLAFNPANVEAHIILGTIHSRRGRYEEAVKEYETALAMKPGHELAEEMRRSISQWKMSSSGEVLGKLRDDLNLFIGQAEGQFGVRLDYSPASLGIMDRLIDAGWNLKTGGIGVLRLAGTYVGEVVLQNLGGEWRIMQPVEESEIAGLGRQGIRPFFIALEKFQKGRQGSLLGSYNALAGQLGAG